MKVGNVVFGQHEAKFVIGQVAEVLPNKSGVKVKTVNGEDILLLKPHTVYPGDAVGLITTVREICGIPIPAKVQAATAGHSSTDNAEDEEEEGEFSLGQVNSLDEEEEEEEEED